MKSNFKPFWWVTEETQDMLERGYLLPGQTIEEKVRIKAKYASELLNRPDLEDQFFNMIALGWTSLSSPIWANFGESRGLPIACYSSYVPDSIDGIFKATHEVARMTSLGGGTSGYFPLRPKGSNIKGGGKTSGAVSFVEIFDTTIKNVSQSGVRRGGFAAYMDIDHPEILDFMRIKDKDSPMQSINTAVNVTDDFMNRMINGDEKAREVWAEVLRNRREKGIPYISFIDNVNNNAPQPYKDKGLRINQSNLCNEIWLHTSEEESLVCCLSSLNLATYEDWKDSNVVELLTYFLDAVITDFINKTENMSGMERARKFALRSRAIGIGVLGWHSYLQQEGISFESPVANALTAKIFKQIKDQSYRASEKLAEEYGEPELMVGYGRRNVTTMAVAPTTSSSSILGQVSPGIEPFKSNYYVVGLAKGSFPRINKVLEKLLVDKGKNTQDVWKSIKENKGSVQHLDFLSQEEKDVFKTFEEIHPLSIIKQNAIRQKYVDQGVSLNLLIPHSVPIKDINAWYIEAWKLGIKGLYYQRGTSVSKEALLKMLNCSSCEG